ncbi:hypothetical protein [Photobacterium damselae]|uniref:hypothetical protein n=1 Tax=Photobacterium damselae TaxID=38293 RepID=UPI001EFE3B6A|nr:hypothetical protein [Photobacterium damselae]MCG9776804.1 hypothetical protein [Photobacterium damselae]
MSYQKLLETVRTDLESMPNLATACEIIIEKISQKDAKAWQHLTFASINNLCNSMLKPHDVVRITQYLAGERVKLFKTGFEYIGEEGQFILDSENSYFAYHENTIAHPETGKLIKDVKNDVFMFFTVDEEALK